MAKRVIVFVLISAQLAVVNGYSADHNRLNSKAKPLLSHLKRYPLEVCLSALALVAIGWAGRNVYLRFTTTAPVPVVTQEELTEWRLQLEEKLSKEPAKLARLSLPIHVEFHAQAHTDEGLSEDDPNLYQKGGAEFETVESQLGLFHKFRNARNATFIWEGVYDDLTPSLRAKLIEAAKADGRQPTNNEVLPMSVLEFQEIRKLFSGEIPRQADKLSKEQARLLAERTAGRVLWAIGAVDEVLAGDRSSFTLKVQEYAMTHSLSISGDNLKKDSRLRQLVYRDREYFVLERVFNSAVGSREGTTYKIVYGGGHSPSFESYTGRIFKIVSSEE